MVCNHEKREHVNYCGDCGADLTLREEEIKARDRFFGIYKELLKEKQSDVKFDRSMFDVMALQILKMFAGEDKIEVTEPQADALLKVHGLKKESDGDTISCPRCQKAHPQTSKYCEDCGMPFNVKVIIEAEEERNKYDDLMSKLLQDKEVQQLLAKKLRNIKN